MIKKLGLENMLKNKTAAGLEIIILPDGSYQLHLIVLKKQQSTLLTEIQNKEIASFAEVKKLLDPKTPVVLIINGKGIVHRKVHYTENDTSASLLNKLLPNANAEDFIIQQTPLSNEEVFVSVIRLNALSDLIQELTTNQLTSISACFLGPFPVKNLLPLLDRDVIDNEYLYIPNFRLQIREDQITAVDVSSSSPNEHIRIGNDLLSAQLMIAFAGALTYFTGSAGDISNAAIVNQLKEEFRQKQKFEFRGWAILLTTFLILIINYLIFNNYWSQNKAMNTQLQLTQVAMQRFDKLKKEVDQKKQFLEQNGLLESSRTSYFADQIAKELPPSIQLTNLDIHPLKKKKPGDEGTNLLFETKVISVSGNCQQSTELNEWMKRLKKYDWTQEVTLSNYKQDNARENGFFSIEIKLK